LSWINELPLFRIIVQLVPKLKAFLHRIIYLKLKLIQRYIAWSYR